MNKALKPLSYYVSPDAVRSLATPSDFRLGEEIAKNGGVQVVYSSQFYVIAKVLPENGERRTIALRSTEDDFTWKCTCTRKKLFCKHCVAAALAVWDKVSAHQI